jgi:hypothetical protein
VSYPYTTKNGTKPTAIIATSENIVNLKLLLTPTQQDIRKRKNGQITKTTTTDISDCWLGRIPPGIRYAATRKSI